MKDILHSDYKYYSMRDIFKLLQAHRSGVNHHRRSSLLCSGSHNPRNDNLHTKSNSMRDISPYKTGHDAMKRAHNRPFSF